MKNRIKQLAVIMFIMLPLAAVMGQGQGQGPQGQRGQGERNGFGPGEERGFALGIPDLTDEQQEKIKQFHLDLMKESLPVRNQLNENRAKMRTLQTAENPDIKAIESLIDESAKLEADLKKKFAANHQQIRNILTEEQRIIFDSRSGQMRARMNRMDAPGRGYGQGRGMARPGRN